MALGKRGQAHVPHRSSRLTAVLRDALGGNCRTTLVANIWGEARHVEETGPTLSPQPYPYPYPKPEP
jgi:kinesin family protein 6/9